MGPFPRWATRPSRSSTAGRYRIQTRLVQGLSAADWRLAWQSRSQCARLPTCPPGAVTGAGPYAIENIDGKYFAVTRRCRHLRADLAGGSIEDGRLVCPWHRSAYDVENGQMVRGPQQIFAKIPGLVCFK